MGRLDSTAAQGCAALVLRETSLMTNDRVIQQLQSLSERFGAVLDDEAFEAIDQAIEALHRDDVTPSAAEPSGELCPRHGQIVETGCPACKRALNRPAEPQVVSDRDKWIARLGLSINVLRGDVIRLLGTDDFEAVKKGWFQPAELTCQHGLAREYCDACRQPENRT